MVDGVVRNMTIKAKENVELKKLMDWHLHQAAECRSADEVGERDFHVWAATLISMVREIR